MISIKKILRQVLPKRLHPTVYLRDLVRNKTSWKVLSGAFQGLAFHREGILYHDVPLLLGLYEAELTQVIENVIDASPNLVINVGAAEGYYAIGLARRLSSTTIQAFEMSDKRQNILKQNAALNGVSEQIQLRGHCSPEILEDCLGQSKDAVVICDVEGYEAELLDPDIVPALKTVSILVELHEFVCPGITDMLGERFGASHRIEHIKQETLPASVFPYQTILTRIIPNQYIRKVVNERRPERMSWFWMTPKQGGFQNYANQNPQSPS
jgi:hypothetical protein